MKISKHFAKGFDSIADGMASIGEGIISMVNSATTATTVEPPSAKTAEANKGAAPAADAAAIKGDWNKVGEHMDAAFVEIRDAAKRAKPHITAATKEVVGAVTTATKDAVEAVKRHT